MKKILLALTIMICSTTYAKYTVLIGKNDNIQFKTPVPEVPADPNKDNNSCKSLLAETPSLQNGVYQIKSGGAKIAMYCDMTGGGWTLVASGIRYKTTGWATSGDLNLTASPSVAITFKLADAKINAIPKNVFRVKSTGNYTNTRYFNGSCNYNHTAIAGGACLASYSNEALTTGLKQGVAYKEVTGLSDYNASLGTLYVITSYIGSIAAHGWGMGNGVTNGYSGTGAAGDGGNIQIWVK